MVASKFLCALIVGASIARLCVGQLPHEKQNGTRKAMYQAFPSRGRHKKFCGCCRRIFYASTVWLRR